MGVIVLRLTWETIILVAVDWFLGSFVYGFMRAAWRDRAFWREWWRRR